MLLMMAAIHRLPFFLKFLTAASRTGHFMLPYDDVQPKHERRQQGMEAGNKGDSTGSEAVGLRAPIPKLNKWNKCDLT